MSEPFGSSKVTVREGRRVVAVADLRRADGVVHAELSFDSGHLPSATGRRLVDAVLRQPELAGGGRLEVTLPVGNVESLERLRKRCDGVHLHRAGASCLLEGTFSGVQDRLC